MPIIIIIIIIIIITIIVITPIIIIIIIIVISPIIIISSIIILIIMANVGEKQNPSPPSVRPSARTSGGEESPGPAAAAGAREDPHQHCM